MQSHKMLFLTPGGRKIREDQKKKKKEKRNVTNIALSMGSSCTGVIYPRF